MQSFRHKCSHFITNVVISSQMQSFCHKCSDFVTNVALSSHMQSFRHRCIYFVTNVVISSHIVISSQSQSFCHKCCNFVTHVVITSHISLYRQSCLSKLVLIYNLSRQTIHLTYCLLIPYHKVQDDIHRKFLKIPVKPAKKQFQNSLHGPFVWTFMRGLLDFCMSSSKTRQECPL